MAGLGDLFKNIPGIGIGGGLLALLSLMSKKGGQEGVGLPLGVNLETLETTDYKGDPTKFKVFVDSKTGKFYGTAEERDEAIKAAEGGLMALFNLGGMAMPNFGGLLRGPGTGTSDSIPGMIYQDGKPVQRAALSDGEFVMTNKAVKAAGGGSIEKGAKAMYELMNNLERRA
tara:strand:- start:404 stop:919 length:516 start_codon:yes stop_codon:yes gene_type:complete